jgi:hypothetical protein
MWIFRRSATPLDGGSLTNAGPLPITREMAWSDFVASLRSRGYEIVRQDLNDGTGINDGWRKHSIVAAHRTNKTLLLADGAGRVGKEKLSEVYFYFALAEKPVADGAEFKKVARMMDRTSSSMPAGREKGQVVRRFFEYTMSNGNIDFDDLGKMIKADFGKTVAWGMEQPFLLPLPRYLGLPEGTKGDDAIASLPPWIQGFIKP